MNTNFDVVREAPFMEFGLNGLYRAEIFWIFCALWNASAMDHFCQLSSGMPYIEELQYHTFFLMSASMGGVIIIQVPAIYLPQSPEIVFGSAIITQEPKQNVLVATDTTIEKKERKKLYQSS